MRRQPAHGVDPIDVGEAAADSENKENFMPREMMWTVAVMILAGITLIIALLLPEKPTAYCLQKKSARRG
jgi:hypothetical protein